MKHEEEITKVPEGLEEYVARLRAEVERLFDAETVWHEPIGDWPDEDPYWLVNWRNTAFVVVDGPNGVEVHWSVKGMEEQFLTNVSPEQAARAIHNTWQKMATAGRP